MTRERIYKSERTVYHIRRSEAKGKNGLHKYNVRAYGIMGKNRNRLSSPVPYYVYAKNLDDAFRRMKKGEGVEK